jgi:hypothetical protein
MERQAPDMVRQAGAGVEAVDAQAAPEPIALAAAALVGAMVVAVLAQGRVLARFFIVRAGMALFA